MFPVIFEILVVPPLDCEPAFGFKNPAIVESSWLMLAPEYLTLLKFRSAVPLRARMISFELRDFTGPAAFIFRLRVPSPLTLSSEVTPYAFAMARMAGSCALGACTVASTTGEGDW